MHCCCGASSFVWLVDGGVDTGGVVWGSSRQAVDHYIVTTTERVTAAGGDGDGDVGDVIFILHRESTSQ